MARKKIEQVPAQKPVYEWQADAAIPVTGKQWEIIYNGITLLHDAKMGASTPEMVQNLALNDLKNTVNTIFQKAFDEKIITQK